MIKQIFLIIISLLFYFLIKEITNTLNIFYQNIDIVLTIIFMITVFSYFNNKPQLSFISYLLFLVIFLLAREKPERNINFEFYLIEWLSIINKNKIVFINIVGNFVLFMPMVIYLHNKYYFLTIVWIIFVFELLQLVTRRGVFDIVDITLNIIGVVLASILKRRIYGRQRQKK